uniref:DUF302 domain-containing protein n=1 Tax=Candidatus Methanogaster sp. ANME-2c ERB4 TaxID=2759911 RepID=A0A7G9YPY8_9EURY|nr:hypothetical protein NEPELPOK_00023 [Methanosarcinales archaeon ANME-2c ERB4]
MDDNRTKTVITALRGFVLGVIVMMFVMKMAAPGMMIHEVKSPCDFNTTVETVISNAESEGWIVPKVYDFRKSIMDAGSGNVGRIKIIEMCQPEYASGLLGADDTKF